MKQKTLTPQTVIDPICGMEIDPADAAQTRTVDGVTTYFCSDQCAAQFDSQQDAPAADRTLPQSATTGFNPALTGPVKVELSLIGLSCSSCSTTVERVLMGLPGVSEAHVNYTMGKAHVTYDPAQVGVSGMMDAIRKAGYNIGADEMHVRISPGLHCASCVGFIEEALRQVPGVLEATVNPGTDSARIRYAVGQVDYVALKRAIESTGYQAARPVEQEESVDDETAAHQREYGSLMRKFWFATAIGIPVMLVAYPELPWLYLPNLFINNVSESLVWWLFVLSGVITIPVMAYAGLASVLHTREALAAETARLGEIQRCVRFLDRDLRQSVERGIRDAYGDPRPPLRGAALAAGRDPVLELTRAGYRNPLQVRRSQLQRVAYRLQDATLWRDSWRVLDRAQDSQPDSLPLCGGVERVELRFLDAEHEWVPDWPPLQAEAQAESLPLAVEIRLQLKDWGELTRLIPLPGATR